MTGEPVLLTPVRHAPPLRWLVVMVVLVPFAAWLCGLLGERSALAEISAAAAGRADLYRTLLQRELERPAGLPLALAHSALVIEALDGSDGAARRLDGLLAEFVRSADLTDLYVMDAHGLTIAASNAGSDASFVGKDFGFRHYFAATRRGVSGHEFALGTTSQVPGYYVAQPVVVDGQVRGAVVAKIDLARLESLWGDNPERLVLTDRDGTVLLTGDPSLRFHPMPPIGPDYLPWTVDLEGNEWRLTILLPTDTAYNRRWAWGAIGGVGMLALLLISYAATERGRNMRAFADFERESREALEEELKRRTAELVQATKLATIGQMATGMVHEINQPLAAIRSFAGNALRFMELDRLDRVSHNLTEIAGQVDRLAEITRRLKGFARRPDEELAAVALGEVVERVLAMVGPRLREQGVTVDFDAGPVAVCVRAEQIRLEQVLVNLVTNALDAMKRCEDGALSIRINAGPAMTRLSVADTGPGIPDPLLPHLFEPFTTTKPAGEGLGLGLSIASAIVRDFGGQLSACNRAEGGAVFTLDLATAEPV
jgi:two-component system C4-dicarboxylate transport sensor histidine kinase DctB